MVVWSLPGFQYEIPSSTLLE